MKIVSVWSNQSLNLLSYWKATCVQVQYISCPTICVGLENGFDLENRFFIGDWVSINLFEFVQSVGWFRASVDVQRFIICEPNNWQHSSRKVLSSCCINIQVRHGNTGKPVAHSMGEEKMLSSYPTYLCTLTLNGTGMYPREQWLNSFLTCMHSCL